MEARGSAGRVGGTTRTVPRTDVVGGSQSAVQAILERGPRFLGM